MKIDKKKCNAWSEMLLALIKMAKELTKDECTYIKANFIIALGRVELEELEKREKITT